MTGDNRSGEETAPHDAGQSLPLIGHHLYNALKNSSQHSSYIYEHMSHGVGRRNTAMRMAATMRDSLRQMADLVRGEDLDTKDLRQLREAEIYLRVKGLQDRIKIIGLVEPSDIADELEALLTYIRED